MNLLLTSKYSDDFSLGYREGNINKDLESRIIKFRTQKPDLHKMNDFLKMYDKIEKDPKNALRAVYEFYIEKFFEKIKDKFDSVNYIESAPGYTLDREELSYEFCDNGKKIIARSKDKSQTIAEIPRLVKLNKNEINHYVLCVPLINKMPTEKYSNKIEAAKNLIGRNDTLSYMVVYTIDTLVNVIAPKTRKYLEDPVTNMNSAEEFLRKSNTNLFLVYSASNNLLNRWAEESRKS
jgi:hypothetical protein